MAFGYYVPDVFKVGLFNAETSSKGEYAMQQQVFGFPSCRWLGTNQWTEVNKFSQLCGGYKPSEQKNEPEKEIEKAVGLHVKDICNKWTSGFKLLSICGVPYNNNNVVHIRDPRGFCISIEATRFFHILNCTDMSIGSNGELSGEFKYIWSDGKWIGIDYINSKSSSIHVTDTDLKDKISKMVKPDDMQPGTIYTLLPSLMSRYTTEMLYVGDYELPNKEQLVKLLYRYFTNNELGRLRNFACSYSIPNNMLPWTNETYVEKIKRLQSSIQRVPLFVSLSNVARTNVNVNEYDLSNIIALTNVTDQQLLTINLYPFYNYDMFDDNIAWSKTLLKHVAEKSSRQLNDSPGASDRYNIYNFNEIKSAVDKVASRVTKTADMLAKLRPIEKPASTTEYNNWMNVLRKLSFSKNTILAQDLVSLSK